MKTSSLAVAAFLVLGSLAAPVLAAEVDPAFDSSWYVTQLQQKGINAIDAHEGWNGNFRATVKLADGSEQYQYFDVDTLQPVGASGNNTRVLSKLDVGQAKALPTTTRSLISTSTEDDN